MMVLDGSDAHFAYMDVVTHWCPQSQPFAGGDALITYIDDGWEIGSQVFYEEFEHRGGRQVVVYYFEMHRGNQIVRMPVINNPYVTRLVQVLNVDVVPTARANRERRVSQQALVRHA